MGGLMKRIIIAVFLTLLLSACTIQQPAAPTETATTIPTATPEPTPTLSPVEPLLEAYLSGQDIDVSSLSPTEYKEFSVKLAEKMNEKRGINPILYKDEAYISPENYTMMNYDGHPDIEETITMFLAIAGKDSDGSLQIINEKGKVVTIANSADIDWNMRVTDPNDPRIDLANTGKPTEWNDGLTIPQAMVSHEEKYISFDPTILINKNPGSLFFEINKGGEMQLPIYSFIKIETDQIGNPILARKILVFPGQAMFSLYTEGSTNSSSFDIFEEKISSSSFHKQLIINNVYYLGITEHQDDYFIKNLFANVDNYSGIIDGDDAQTVISDQIKNDTDMILLGADVLIKPMTR